MAPSRYALLLGLLVLAGCGGSTHGTLAQSAPRVTVAWPDRSRDIKAPASALAAVITFRGAGTDGGDLTYTVQRPSGAAASTQTYVAPLVVPARAYLLQINFKADAEGLGDTVATATMEVLVQRDGSLTRADGTPLGNVSFVSTIQTVAIVPPDSIDIGAEFELPISVSNLAQLITISPGSVQLTVTEGSDVLRAEGGTTMTALKEGFATVVATVDGISSTPVRLTVSGPALTARSMNVLASQIVADPTHGLVWAASGQTGDTFDRVYGIDPSNGSIVRTIATGGAVAGLAISDDGSALYVGDRDASKIRRYDPATGTLVKEFGLGTVDFPVTGIRPMRIAVAPGNPSQISVTAAAVDSSATFGPFVYDDGVRRPAEPGIYEAVDLLYTSPTRLVTLGSGSPVSVYDFRIEADGAHQQRYVFDALKYWMSHLVFDGVDRLYSSDGKVLDATTFALLGDFLPSLQMNSGALYSGVAVDRTKGRAYFIGTDGAGARLHVFDTATFKEIASRKLTGPDWSVVPGDMSGEVIRWGTNGLAFRTTDRIVFIDQIPDL